MEQIKKALLLCMAVSIGLVLAGCAGTQSAAKSGPSAEVSRPTPNDAVFANRQPMRIEGLDNIRDIGGYKTADGKTVKKGLLYRADALSKMTPNGIAQFERLNIGYIFDLRSDGEIARKPDPAIKGAAYYQTRVADTTATLIWPSTDEETYAFYSGPASRNYYIAASEYMVIATQSRESLKTILTIARENKESKGLIWHCSGGKDRTGYISAVFLSLLGVDNETIIQEYLLTNIDRKEFDEKEREYMDAEYFHGDKTMMEGFLAVQEARREYVDIFLSGIQNLYGTVDNYVITELGLTQEDLNSIKSLYTE
ncbi:MAG: tyrosine-protein phosphatase [Spirochaetaceae bacterium]|jgi:protein-tyrosine phosphatase|nr:tyrosine-protein phosphatase [Spirochaetaceae bacterium]